MMMRALLLCNDSGAVTSTLRNANNNSKLALIPAAQESATHNVTSELPDGAYLT